jgi:uncharacterized protein (DUF58 family)
MRRSLNSLTPRGAGVLSAGVVVLISGWLAGQADLLRVGTLLVSLPLLAMVFVMRNRERLAARRRVDPQRVSVGAPARSHLVIENRSRLPSGTVLVEDHADDALGGATRFVLERIPPNGRREVSTELLAQRRGRYLVGPLRVWLADPFGLCRLTWTLPKVDTLTVTPATEQVPAVPLGGEWSGSGDSRTRAIASTGEDDVTPRGYRVGDELRRVHWKSTARLGELMVRREEQPWESRAVLLLDNRFGGHSGSGNSSTFERAVSITASLGVYLGKGGFTVDLVTASPPTDQTRATESAADPLGGLLDLLAVVRTDRSARLSHTGPGLARLSGDGVVIAVLGHLSLADAEELSRLRHGREAAVAVLVDPGGATHEQAPLILRQGGWRVVPVALDEPLATAWPLAARRSAGVLR